MDAFTFDWGVAVALLAVVLFLMFAACGLVVALGLAANRRRADLTWTAAPGPATSWDEHCATSPNLLVATAGGDEPGVSVADEAEQYLRDLTDLNRHKES